MRLSRVVGAVFFIHSLSALGQFSDPEVDVLEANIRNKPVPREERYLYPISPGLPGSLAGNMGELRTTHFHSGIDIRTDNKSGYPVHASKSGYISRAAMSATGYGNVLYITHPDGNTTLYAHLEYFKGAVADYVLREQYNRKTFEIDLVFPKDQFVVKQGDTIAISGNTGSSGGPHLHFDIRDINNHALDPLQFGFPEIFDNTPPAAEKIALITLDKNARINDRFGRFEFYAHRVGNQYVIANPIFAHGNIGVELLAKDRFSPRSAFYGGVKYIDMKVDSQLVFSQAIDKINTAETRSIYTLMDFKIMRMGGSRFYKLYVDDGNNLPFYKTLPSTGKINVTTAKPMVNVQIALKDTHGNSSAMSFRLKPSAPIKEVSTLGALKSDVDYDISENILVISARTCKQPGDKGYIYTNGTPKTVDPDYYNALQSVYLIDLRRLIPDSVVICGNAVVPHIKASIPPGIEYKYYGDWADVEFTPTTLYDTLYFNTSYIKIDSEEIFTIGDRTVPLNSSISVSLRPLDNYLVDKRLGVYRKNGRSYSYIGGEWINDRVHFNAREFGDFTILTDSIAPDIRPLRIDNHLIRLRIKDDLSGMSSYQATLNGQWLLMHHDQKTATVWSEPRNKSEALRGNFQLIVTDNAGNKQVYDHTIP